MKTTVVTMFFNLKDLPDATTATRPPSFYVEKGRATLGLRAPMIIFCDAETQPALQEIRQSEVGDLPTEYIVKPLVDYELFQRAYPIVAANRRASPHYSTHPNDRNTASYFLTCMFKTLALQIAHERNPFGSAFFAWIDLGCSHVVRDLQGAAPRMLEEPGPRARVCYIHYRPRSELYPMSSFLANGGPCGIAGTAFTVEGTYVQRYASAMWSIFHEMLVNGVGHTDEQVMTYCYDRYPELFSLYFGDYYSVITNYHRSVEDHGTVRAVFVGPAQAAGRPDLASAAIQSLA